MARIRSIKPEFPQSESMGRVSRESRLCFLMLWTILDDEGRARGSSRMLASLLYPYDDDAPKKIDGWLTELEAEGCIIRYSIGSDHYIASVNWLKHQKIDRPSPSRHPAPPTKPKQSDTSPREPSRQFDADLGSGSGSGSRIGTKEEEILPGPIEAPFIAIPTNHKGEEFHVLKALVDEFQKSYPAVDVPAQLRKIRSWSLSNPDRRKTKNGMRRFINSWLSKEQDKNHGPTNGTTNGTGRRETAHDRFLEGTADLIAEIRARGSGRSPEG
jgi:hypothetical protein